MGAWLFVLWQVFMATEDPIVRRYRIFFIGDFRDGTAVPLA